MKTPRWWYTADPIPRWAQWLTPLYRGVQRIHQALCAPSIESPWPVISVGNVVMGGSGKTPTTLLLARLLQSHGFHPVIITRGYTGRLKGPLWVNPCVHTYRDVGEEALILAAQAPTILAAKRSDALSLFQTSTRCIYTHPDHHLTAPQRWNRQARHAYTPYGEYGAHPASSQIPTGDDYPVNKDSHTYPLHGDALHRDALHTNPFPCIHPVFTDPKMPKTLSSSLLCTEPSHTPSFACPFCLHKHPCIHPLSDPVAPMSLKPSLYCQRGVFLLDDAHQHQSLKKDLSILVMNAQQKWGNGQMCPAGPLREPLDQALKRTQMVFWICDQDTHAQPGTLPEPQDCTPPCHDPDATICKDHEPDPQSPQQDSLSVSYAAHQVNCAPSSQAQGTPCPYLQDLWQGQTIRLSASFTCALPLHTRVMGFAGLGFPERFHRVLAALFPHLQAFVALEDHVFYTPALLKELQDKALHHQAQLVTTEKDWIKLPPSFQDKVAVVHQTLDFTHDADLQHVLMRIKDVACKSL
jgi:tetraacyldisaccharide-1-P 4'-kinase